MRCIKQPRDTNYCVTACLAMVTDLSFYECLEGVKEIVRLVRPDIHDISVVPFEVVTVFLAKHGWFLGYSANFQPLLSLCEDDVASGLDIGFRLDDYDALLTVVQDESSQRHLVCWDSVARKVRDPHWNAPDGYDISQVKISQWYPLVPKKQVGWP